MDHIRGARRSIAIICKSCALDTLASDPACRPSVDALLELIRSKAAHVEFVVIVESEEVPQTLEELGKSMPGRLVVKSSYPEQLPFYALIVDRTAISFTAGGKGGKDRPVYDATSGSQLDAWLAHGGNVDGPLFEEPAP